MNEGLKIDGVTLGRIQRKVRHARQEVHLPKSRRGDDVKGFFQRMLVQGDAASGKPRDVHGSPSKRNVTTLSRALPAARSSICVLERVRMHEAAVTPLVMNQSETVYECMFRFNTGFRSAINSGSCRES